MGKDMEKSRINRTRLWAWLLILFALVSCRQDARLEQALHLSGSNRTELEKVLAHFEGDSLKYAAACFLIENMPGAFGVDSSVLSVYAPFYKQYDSWSHTFDYDSLFIIDGYSRKQEWGGGVDSLWKSFSERKAWRGSKKMIPDLQSVSSARLITEIEQSFKAWKENVYTQNASFEDFCEYILPYRRINSLLIDSARQVFYARYGGHFFVTEGKEMIDEADSLLYRCRKVVHCAFYGTNIPIHNAATFEYLGHGLCEHRCWFNSLLFSSLGMAVAIDFVPSWGNRNSGHSWNVLIKDGQSYAFEPFWDADRWKYKRIYNNRTHDIYWGRFRLPKVFRYTYRRYVEGPPADKDMILDDIPLLFRNLNKKDVSHEYFDTTDVNVPLKDIPSGMKYAYLCVEDYAGWQPVQWGKIENGTACFKGMGKDIVYLPMYCVGGVMQPAASPFLLRSDGSMQVLDARRDKQKAVIYDVETTGRYGKYYKCIKLMQGSSLSGGKEIGNMTDTLCTFPSDMEIYNRKVPVVSNRPVRYVRLHLPEGYLALGNLQFYKKDSNGSLLLDKVKSMRPLPLSDKGEPVENIFDEWGATGYKAPIPIGYVDFDLGENCQLSHVDFCPYLESGFMKEREYELWYWQDGWRMIDKASGGDVLRFDKVPENALLMLVHLGTKKVSRPFIYENNEVHWY